MRKKILSTATLVSLVGLFSLAHVTSYAEGADSAYSVSGCGVGSLILKEDTKLMQILSSVVNLTFAYTNSFAMLSMTSNCVPKNVKLLAYQEQKVFISSNLSNLSKEAAQGSGEHVVSLAKVFGCPQNEFVQMSRAQYAEIYQSYDPSDVHTNYIQAVKNDPTLSKSCTRETI